MTRKMVSGRWSVAALVAVLLVTAVPADASPLPASWTRLVTWLGGWSGLGPALTATLGEDGVAIDPLGSWGTSGQRDDGVAIDPDGSWGTSGQGDDGVAINPDGRKG